MSFALVPRTHGTRFVPCMPGKLFCIHSLHKININGGKKS